jgi:hypothetical protein
VSAASRTSWTCSSRTARSSPRTRGSCAARRGGWSGCAAPSPGRASDGSASRTSWDTGSCIAGRCPYWICTEEQMRNSGNDLMERQANVFAGEFLMPEEIFRPHAEACEPSIANIIRLAETFRTSLSSTALNFLRLCARDAAVICTQNGKIHWDSRPAGCTLPQAKQGYPVGPEAALHSARFDPPVSAEKTVGPVEVPGSAWYPKLERLAARGVDRAAREPRGFCPCSSRSRRSGPHRCAERRRPGPSGCAPGARRAGSPRTAHPPPGGSRPTLRSR